MKKDIKDDTRFDIIKDEKNLIIIQSKGKKKKNKIVPKCLYCYRQLARVYVNKSNISNYEPFQFCSSSCLELYGNVNKLNQLNNLDKLENELRLARQEIDKLKEEILYKDFMIDYKDIKIDHLEQEIKKVIF